MIDGSSQSLVEILVARLRRRQVVGSRTTALETVLVLRHVVSNARFSTIEQLLDIVRLVGRRLVEAQPKEYSVGNTVRKVLHHMREEYHTATKSTTMMTPSIVDQDNGDFSISKFVLQGQPRHNTTLSKSEEPNNDISPKENDDDDDDEDEDEDTTSVAEGLKPVLLEAIQDVLDELETVYDNVSKNAKDHIHSDEIILTIGKSNTVQAFLKSAAHYRNFTVIVAETAPSYGGRVTAQSLSSAGISTLLVPDSSIYAIMSRVNKVILGAHAILADGGIFAVTGSLLATSAARAHSTPVVVCAGQFKLTPVWNLYHEYGALDFGDPSDVLAFKEGDLVDKVNVINPYYDYVGPENIDAFITNDGDHPPSSLHRLVEEAYDDEDYEL